MGSANSLQPKGSYWCQQVGIDGMNEKRSKGVTEDRCNLI